MKTESRHPVIGHYEFGTKPKQVVVPPTIMDQLTMDLYASVKNNKLKSVAAFNTLFKG